jgi:hypothetical protein
MNYVFNVNAIAKVFYDKLLSFLLMCKSQTAGKYFTLFWSAHCSKFSNMTLMAAF